MTKRQSLGSRIAQARRELGVREHRDVSQLDLANAIGVAAATLSRWESDLAMPRDDAFVKLARYLGVDPGYLRYGTARPAVQEGPDQPSEKDRAEWLNGEMEAARIEREQADAALKAAGSKAGRTRRR